LIINIAYSEKQYELKQHLSHLEKEAKILKIPQNSPIVPLSG